MQMDKASENNTTTLTSTNKEIITDSDQKNITANPEKPAVKITTKVKTKRRKRKIPRPLDAPKHPLTGYIRFMNVRREELRKIHPTYSAIDITKIIGEEWNQLNNDDRKPFLEAAEVDKERYNREWMAYIAKKKSDESSSETTEVSASKTNGIDEKPKDLTGNNQTVINTVTTNTAPAPASIVPASVPKLPQSGDYDIPIFTEEFLEHNKIMDTKLRTQRKTNTDYEQQNSVLEKHVDNMNSGIDKLVNELAELHSNHDVLSNYLTNLKQKLATALSGLSIPSEPNGANLENIDKYMADLHRMATSNSHGPASLNKAKDIIRKLDLQTTTGSLPVLSSVSATNIT